MSTKNQKRQDEAPKFELSQLRGGSKKIAQAATQYMNNLNSKKGGDK